LTGLDSLTYLAEQPIPLKDLIEIAHPGLHDSSMVMYANVFTSKITDRELTRSLSKLKNHNDEIMVTYTMDTSVIMPKIRAFLAKTDPSHPIEPLFERESFKELMKFYTSGNNGFSMVAFHLDQTLSSSGGVTRGICEVMNDKLSSVNETSNIQKIDNCITSEDNVEWEGKELVSMNMWGFTPVLFNYLKEMFLHFLNEKGEEIDSEFLIPTVINDLIQNDRETVQVLRSNSLWFGVTYKEDKPYVVEAIQKLITSGKYPQKLFE